jgi:hypothetical protein
LKFESAEVLEPNPLQTIKGHLYLKVESVDIWKTVYVGKVLENNYLLYFQFT